METLRLHTHEDPSGAVGLPTREASRTLEYALSDLAVRQAVKALNKSFHDVTLYGNRSMGFVNVWDPNVTSDGFTGFSQRRSFYLNIQNGTFAFSPPDACSPVDPTPHSCARGTDNNVGFYEFSSLPTLLKLMGGNDTFISRLDHYFEKGYFYAGNEPGFEAPWLYHYANRPDLRNDDSGAMAVLLVFHLLGLYPVPASKQLLIGPPFVCGYKLSNNLFDS
ncbi:glycoside hydrolase family 92 protein [Piloderma croceum F 1598]|uniref:Glycoside hydrolase family 92 protein n=1 Tax=Piloderma croceum (strain F 1598) TaxID=765440 RepID=A0A0C3FKX9_PILCF|nr:glycoside hydrolase family 92 protein [Piloderma croceum F 1598]